MTDFISALILGFILDLIAGDPEWLYHPVRLIGKFISFMEKRLRRRGGDLRKSALILTSSTVILSMLAVWAVLALLGAWGRLPRFIGMVIFDWMGLAVRSMAGEARGVRLALNRGIEDGRRQVARIVGRDTDSLTEEEIIKATVETVAENTTDGVISPMLYAAIGGPVLMWGFKAASTLDSMVGYMDEKYRDIGWSSARLDDVLNFIPARICAYLMCLAAFPAGLDGFNARRIVRRDHANHTSPNCAWSEAAAAGALHLQLGGTHFYFGRKVVKPTIGDDERRAERNDISGSVRLLYATSVTAMALITLLALIVR